MRSRTAPRQSFLDGPSTVFCVAVMEWNGRHETFDDAEVVMDDLRQRREAVCGAGGVGDDLHIGRILVLIDAHDEHRRIGGRSGDDDLLGAARKVRAGLVDRGEHTGGLDDVFRADSFHGISLGFMHA